MTTTHYIVSFTSRQQRLQMSACGRFVEIHEHSVTPDCPKCANWLESDTEEAAALMAKWDAEDAQKKVSTT